MQLTKLNQILNCLSKKLDKYIVSKKISQNEIIVRTLTIPKHINKEKGIIESRKFTDFFLQYKGGVSVNRYRYASENDLKNVAKETFKDKELYAGFSVFSVSIFNRCLLEVQKGNFNFNAKLIATPLDENANTIKSKIILRKFSGNLSHADIVYSENNKVTLEKPNTAVRVFSRTLASSARNILDEEIENTCWVGQKFST